MCKHIETTECCRGLTQTHKCRTPGVNVYGVGGLNSPQSLSAHTRRNVHLANSNPASSAFRGISSAHQRMDRVTAVTSSANLRLNL